MIDFNALRKTRGQNTQAMQRALEKSEGGYKADERIWKYTRNAEDLSINVIRFLGIAKVDMEMAAEGKCKEEDLTPMIKLLRHRFKGNTGKWLVELSPQTFGEDDPVREWTMPQWSALKGLDKEEPSVKAKREKLKDFIPSTEYYANILVKLDQQNPQNNGKVMLFQFGEAIRKILDLAQNPKFPTDPKFDPFDMWEGADCHLNLTFEKRNFGGRESYVPKFEGVKWAAQAPVGDDAFIEKIWGEQHSLMEFLDRKNFKSFDELKVKFCEVMGFDENYNPKTANGSVAYASAGQMAQQDRGVSAPAQAPAAPVAHTPVAAAAPAPAPAAGNDDLAALEALLQG